MSGTELLEQLETAESRMAIDDNTLMVCIRDGNEDAFFELVSRYKHLMVNYLFRMLNNYDLAVELSQEVFLRVHRNAGKYDSRLKFSTWIYKIATNLAIDELRRIKRRPLSSLSSDTIPEARIADQPVRFHLGLQLNPDPEESILQAEISQQIKRAVQSLPPDQQHIFILKEMEQMPLEEISRITGVKLGTLKSRLYRARQFLKENLNGYLSRGLSL